MKASRMPHVSKMTETREDEYLNVLSDISDNS